MHDMDFFFPVFAFTSFKIFAFSSRKLSTQTCAHMHRLLGFSKKKKNIFYFRVSWYIRNQFKKIHSQKIKIRTTKTKRLIVKRRKTKYTNKQTKTINKFVFM